MQNPRPTSVNAFKIMHNINYEFPHGAFFLNSTKWYQGEAILQVWPGESKWNPHWVIVLTNSFGTNTNMDHMWYRPSECHFTAILQVWSIKLNPRRVIMLTSSSDTNYVLSEHENIHRYGPNAIPPKLMPCYIYSASLVNQKVRHTGHAIVSWPNPKQWLMIHTSGLMMIIR